MTGALPCSLWFFDKGKDVERLDKVLFIDARNYYTVVDRTLNEWSEWQLKNLNAIVWLYRGETEKYQALLEEYCQEIQNQVCGIVDFQTGMLATELLPEFYEDVITVAYDAKRMIENGVDLSTIGELKDKLSDFLRMQKAASVRFADYLEENKDYETWSRGKDGACQISRLLFEEATDINFYVGKAINPAHQNPDLPINFSIKMNLVQKLSDSLRKMGKRIKVSYF